MSTRSNPNSTWAARNFPNLVSPSSWSPIRGKILKNLSMEAKSPEWTAASNLVWTIDLSFSSASWSSLKEVSSVLPVKHHSSENNTIIREFIYFWKIISPDMVVLLWEYFEKLRALSKFHCKWQSDVVNYKLTFIPISTLHFHLLNLNH